jgi:hypothetical protein
MSFHGSGINEQIYDHCRMAMFGDEDLSRFDDELDEKESFIGWAISEGEILDYIEDESEARTLLSAVFDNEVRQYREGVSE